MSRLKFTVHLKQSDREMAAPLKNVLEICVLYAQSEKKGSCGEKGDGGTRNGTESRT